MRITPLDVRKQEFRRGMRGYDGDEVRAFLANLADEYEAVLVDNKQLRERILEQDEKLVEYRNIEKTLRDTLMTAEKVMKEAKDNAHRESEVMVLEARQRVQQTLAEGRARLEELRREALAVHREKEAFLARFRSLAEAQIQFVESHRVDFAAFDDRLLQGTNGARDAARVDMPRPTAPQSQFEGQEDTSTATIQERDLWRDYEPTVTPPRKPTEPASPEKTAEAVKAVPEAVAEPPAPTPEVSVTAAFPAAAAPPDAAKQPEPKHWG